ncbi:hypothetical protein ACFQ0D_23530 [Micromonospora zhanjiangensis]
MGTIFAGVSEAPAAAATLYYKVGTHVSKDTVFASPSNLHCFAPAGHGATMCVRYDKRVIYVRSDAKNGYFKLGQVSAAGRIYLCQNNYKNSSGQNTWVACQWNWPKPSGRCYVPRTGHGQADWYELSFGGPLKCY